MNSYPLQLNVAASLTISAQADLFVYESAMTAPETGDARIIVKPDTGNEIVLRPGQAFRLPAGERATTWSIRARDQAVEITGDVIIGSGEFFDANTVNTFKLDGTFANNVTVNNTEENRVKVELPGSLDVSEPIMDYTSTFAASAIPNGATQIVSAAANTGGVVVTPIWCGSDISMCAGVAAPTSRTSGDVLSYSLPSDIHKRYKVPAGKGVWTYATASSAQPMAFLIKAL